MTTEYDELLAFLDARAVYGGVASAQASAAIRALTAQVVERDAVIVEVRSWREFWARESPILSSRVEFADLDSVLSQAPRDAVGAHDKTVRATALRDAAGAIRQTRLRFEDCMWPDRECVCGWHTADQEEGKV